MANYGLTRNRVVAVVVALDDGTEQVGSGYLVSDRLVLTAEHATRHKDTSPTAAAVTAVWVVQVATGATAELDAPPLADPVLDVAVLTLKTPAAEEWPTDVPVVDMWGVDRAAPGVLIDCVVIGLPRFAYDPRKNLCGTAELHGNVNQTDGAETGHLTMREPTLHGVADPLTGHAGWRGLSGALVFYQSRALGMVVEHHPYQGDNSVSLIGFEKIAENPALRAALSLPVQLPPAPAWTGGGPADRPIVVEPVFGAAHDATSLGKCWAALSGTVVLPPDVRCRRATMDQAGRTLVAASEDGTITTLRYDGERRRFPVRARKLVLRSEWDCWFSGPGTGLSRLDLRTGRVTGVIEDPGEILALAAGQDCIVAARIPRGKTGGRLLRVDVRSQNSIEFKAILRVGTQIAVDSAGEVCGYVKLGDATAPQLWVVSLDDGKTLWKRSIASKGPVAFSPDGLSLALGHHVDGKVSLWRNVYEPHGISLVLPTSKITALIFVDSTRIAISGPQWSGVLDSSDGNVPQQVPWRGCFGAQVVDDVLISYGTGLEPPHRTPLPTAPSTRRQRLSRLVKTLVAASQPQGLILDVRPAVGDHSQD